MLCPIFHPCLTPLTPCITMDSPPSLHQTTSTHPLWVSKCTPFRRNSRSSSSIGFFSSNTPTLESQAFLLHLQAVFFLSRSAERRGFSLLFFGSIYSNEIYSVLLYSDEMKFGGLCCTMDEKKKRRESKERKETRQVSHNPVIMLLSLNDSLELKE